jgi:hypothetical protein
VKELLPAAVEYYVGLVMLGRLIMHTAEPLLPEPTPFKAEIAIVKQEVKHYVMKSINSLILFGVRNSCLISGGSLLLYQFTRRAIKQTS